MKDTLPHNTIFRDAVMLRTYCRDIQTEDGNWIKEKPSQVFDRVINSFKTYYKNHIERIPFFAENPDWETDWKNRMTCGKALPAGRMLWSMGSSTIGINGFLPLMNCAFVVFDDPVEPLLFLAKMLMLGCGVGFSIENRYFQSLIQKFNAMRFPLMPDFMPTIGEDKINGYIVVDSKEGWLSFLGYVIRRGIQMRPVRYDLSGIRPAGSRIKGFGGRSGDPKILGTVAERIYMMLTEERNATKQMYYDVACSIGELIISGNVRRSALMAISDPNDRSFLRFKKFTELAKSPWRCYCNNSVNATWFEDLNADFWATYEGESESYGWVNMDKCRLRDQLESRIRNVQYVLPQGFNPCGEQPLASHEVCCLGEVNLATADTPEDLYKSLQMCYFFCKFAFTLGCDEPKTYHVVKINNRIGISLTGIAMGPVEKVYAATTALNKLYEFDVDVSRILGMNPSVALSTVKPGGTLPKIAGSSGPGIHRPISEYQIRRVRFSGKSSMLKWFEKYGLPIEPQRNFDGTDDQSGTRVVSFYLKNQVPHDGHFSDWLATPKGFIEMIRLIETVQTIWSDNAVSCTVYYNVNDLETTVKPTLRTFFNKLKTFSGMIYSGHNFPQAPEEPITKKQYNEFVRSHPITDYDLFLECDFQDTPEDFGQCDTKGSCSDR